MAQNSSEAFRTPCLCATVRRAARLLSRRYEEALLPSGVTPNQFEIMMVLRHAGPADQGRLASLLEMDQTTLSRNLRPLERERWVAEERPQTDRRKRLYQLTPLGLTVLTEAHHLWRDAHAQMERALGEPVTALWPTFDRILDAARAPFQQPPGPRVEPDYFPI